MPTLTIRRAAAADAPAVAGLNAGLFAADSARHDPLVDQGWPDREGEAYFQDLLADGRSAGWLAVDGDEPVGYAVGRLSGPSTIRPAIVAELESIFVVDTRRSDGLGERLVDEFVAWARDEGARALQVTAYAANDRARAFYERVGFAPRSVILVRPL
jgi:GNAT superfamily N-acetyltransferase